MLKILTLEDELEINDFYQILLKEFEHTVYSVATSEEALDVARKEKLDLALVDHRLSLSNSSKNGLETIEELKKMQPAMKIIMVSANYPEGLEDKYKEHGIDVLVRKPFHIDEMLYHIKHLTKKTPAKS
ncbi:MAG: response regulator [Candidatus Omnitrophica bacterium]|nr:response regulator [Candidatus Omnitrophota bacterium]